MRKNAAYAGLTIIALLVFLFYQGGENVSSISQMLRGGHKTALVGEQSLTTENARIIKVTVFYGEGMLYKGSEENVSPQILAGHTEHARRHGHKQIIQKQNLMGSIYTKPATILNVILEELNKPEDKRAEWVFWHDADTVIMNPTIDLATFLPGPEFKDDIHLLVTNDHNGLNNGVFFVRVNAWAVELFSGIIGINKVNPQLKLDHEDQGAMENIITMTEFFRSKTTVVPRTWMNAYVYDQDLTVFKPGYLLVHAVADSKVKLPELVRTAARHLRQYEPTPEESGLKAEVASFWEGSFDNTRLF
ncbi:hypothetical protein CBS101457_004946 [Exobasidium rhododendri]|nr:hypothetical protein CBS101457_004946 [Exobasidium rhododendri]